VWHYQLLLPLCVKVKKVVSTKMMPKHLKMTTVMKVMKNMKKKMIMNQVNKKMLISDQLLYHHMVKCYRRTQRRTQTYHKVKDQHHPIFLYATKSEV